MDYTPLMRQALDLALRGRGFVEPNPMVGAIVLDAAGQVVGQGWHARYGGPHAEVFALNEAGEQARGGTLIVTLEPCCHHGKTPPCTEAVIAAGIRHVVIAMSDPFPKVAGRGITGLQQAGITVQVGICEAEARALTAPFLKRVLQGKPYLHAKWAMTLDGRIATRTGSSKWVSNETSRQVVHELRGRMDAILVGGGTVRHDDPLLTARPPGPRVATRVVITPSADLPHDCQLARTADEVPVLVFTAQPEKITWPAAEVRPFVSLDDVLNVLAERCCTNVLIEAGPTLMGALFYEIDELHVFVAPKLVGTGLPPLNATGLEQMSDAARWNQVTIQALDGDAYIHCRR